MRTITLLAALTLTLALPASATVKDGHPGDARHPRDTFLLGCWYAPLLAWEPELLYCEPR